MDLLPKTRRVNALLQNTEGNSVDFNKMAELLSDIIDVNVYIVDRTGGLTGLGLSQNIENPRIIKMLEERLLPDYYTNGLTNITTTTANIDVNSQHSIFPEENKELFKNGFTTIIPIFGGGERLGTLILSRLNEEFLSEDLLLGEYSATVIGMEVLRKKSDEMAEIARVEAAVKIAINSLSYSELEAIDQIFTELDGREGILVASKIADQAGITRSVIVNALRKLESAGIIESRSLGMKGTFIKVLNDKFLSALELAKI